VRRNNLRVEFYDRMDELILSIGFTRSIAGNAPVNDMAKSIQSELFKFDSAIGTP
jgi:cob(I)alamin adenosyltransferase